MKGNIMKKRSEEIAKDLEKSLVDFCSKITSIPSEPGQEEEVAKVYMEKMRQLGYHEVFSDPWGNVVGIIRGNEPGPMIMYNGHMDAVPAGDPTLWEDQDPYSGAIKTCPMYDKHMEKEEETKAILGRGIADLKGGAAAQMYCGAVLARLIKEGYPVKGTFMLSQVVLEENGEALGTIKLLENFREEGLDPDAMVCCEPSSLKLMLGHRGRCELKVEVEGKSCHGSSPWLGVNAVVKAAKLIPEIEKKIWTNGRVDEDLGQSGIALTMLDIEPNELCIVPNKCTIVYDRRLVPGETVEDAVMEIQEVIDAVKKDDPELEAQVSINKNLRRSYTGKECVIESKKEVWKIDKEHPFVKACSEGLASMGLDVELGYWPFSTDCPAMNDLGKPVIGYSGLQEYYIHTTFERARVDYILESLRGNIGIFLEASKGF